ncbi:MAG: DUF2007 domain-containing protein [Leptospirales bacterium]|nr:DUF2007 domain-containing protein [Leptospirales bacterium]
MSREGLEPQSASSGDTPGANYLIPAGARIDTRSTEIKKMLLGLMWRSCIWRGAAFSLNKSVLHKMKKLFQSSSPVEIEAVLDILDAHAIEFGQVEKSGHLGIEAIPMIEIYVNAESFEAARDLIVAMQLAAHGHSPESMRVDEREIVLRAEAEKRQQRLDQLSEEAQKGIIGRLVRKVFRRIT